MSSRKIDILYFAGCPNHLPAVELARSVVTELSLSAEINEVEVHDAEDAVSRGFLGSPSIQVDGVDVEPAARSRRDYGFSCRTYSGHGLPSRSMLVSALAGDALTEAGASREVAVGCCAESEIAEQKNWGLMASTGSVLVAMAASACCWVPLVLIAFGLSAGGLGVTFDIACPYLLAASIGLLSVGFLFAYRRPKCDPVATCETGRIGKQGPSRGMLWGATIAVGLFASLPLYVGQLLPDPSNASAESINTASTTVGLHVDGMTCEACAFTLRDELVRLSGVVDARVSYRTGRVDLVLANDFSVRDESLLEIVRSAGFQGTLVNNDQENSND